MTIYLATDHGGYELKEEIKAFLKEKEYSVFDCGAFGFNPKDDYPDFISIASAKISKNPKDMAIIFGGSGQGEAILANKYKNVRCAVFYGLQKPELAIDIDGNKSEDPFEMLRLTRQHNNSNILSLGARLLSVMDAKKAVEVFLTTPFLNEERHVRRIEKIKEIEKTL